MHPQPDHPWMSVEIFDVPFPIYHHANVRDTPSNAPRRFQRPLRFQTEAPAVELQQCQQIYSKLHAHGACILANQRSSSERQANVDLVWGNWCRLFRGCWLFENKCQTDSKTHNVFDSNDLCIAQKYWDTSTAHSSYNPRQNRGKQGRHKQLRVCNLSPCGLCTMAHFSLTVLQTGFRCPLGMDVDVPVPN